MRSGKPSRSAARWSSLGGKSRRALRTRLIKRDGTKCRHCGRQTTLECERDDPRRTTIDHWPVPRRDLPVSEWLNADRCVIACLGCNQEQDRATQVQEGQTK